MSLRAASPDINAAVFASAGSGKTWLLVTRLLRLLLAGENPGGVLAVTFTRKAAGEMRLRLLARLREWAMAPPEALNTSLEQIGVHGDEDLLAHARALYERVLFSTQPLRITTFHALCQDILRRFPLEAAVPPGFELLESTGELRAQAWDALFAEATQDPEGELAAALETLFDSCRGLENTRIALNSFLEHRGDWWAFTEHETDPVALALDRLATYLEMSPGVDPRADFFTEGRVAELQRFAELLRRHSTATHEQWASTLEFALSSDRRPHEAFTDVLGVFLTAGGEPRKRKPSQIQARAMTPEGERDFLAIHAQVADALIEVASVLARQRSFAANRAWFRAGHRYLQHYERLKRELRVLDFADLEWRAYRLLNHADNALWVQYKLDERIDHLLIDEFQDTNPTQWRLILPLLEELAGGDSGRSRSVFLVGDPKQSIYAFRRAKPELQETAAEWLREHLGAELCGLDKSWRSAAVIMEVVNRVFSEGRLAERIGAFPVHETARTELWGRVELLPLSHRHDQRPTEPDLKLRNPLEAPRPYPLDESRLEEGRRIAACIRALKDQHTPIATDEGARPIDYGDIVILLRSRTHASAIEQGLREAGVPYRGIERGTLLDSQEIADLVALLELIAMPHNDLALAQVLRSPLFDVTDEDLVGLARSSGGSWTDRLQSTAPGQDRHGPLGRAWRLLNEWRDVAGQIPIHDLLDQIFHHGDVIERYRSAVRPERAPVVAANLQHFLELALEVDSGRYPTIIHFLARLQSLKARGDEAPDSPPASGVDARVRMMTIHAAKGLEAPVVFLADSATQPTPSLAYGSIVDWPAGADRPQLMMLAGRSSDRDALQQTLIDASLEVEAREQANLLYVALTRARQYLFVSATGSPNDTDLGWYGAVRQALESVGKATKEGGWRCESGTAPLPDRAPTGPASPKVEAAPDLRAPLPPIAGDLEIAPSHRVRREGRQSEEDDARLRGVAVHRLLEMMSGPGASDEDAVLRRIASELSLAADDPELGSWLAEARATIAEPGFRDLFDPDCYTEAWNEVPILYQGPSFRIHGVVDRLIRHDSSLLVIDYKTHRVDNSEQAARLLSRYSPQLRLYRDAVADLWPGLRVDCALLFTANRTLVRVPLEPGAPQPHISSC